MRYLPYFTFFLLLFVQSKWSAGVAYAQLFTPAEVKAAETRAKELLQTMTLRQKVREMHGKQLLRTGITAFLFRKIDPFKSGGNKRLNIPPMIFFDGPRGVGMYRGATAFPVSMARGASWDTDLETRIGSAIAREVRALGGNYSGAVCLNLLRHPAWGRAQETYGEDPHHVGEMAWSLAAGIQMHRVQACAKHFAANSMENNRYGGSMNMNERTLHEVYLPHFKKVTQRGVASIMSAYNRLNGEYCGQNKLLLTDILRTDWGFKGYVVSDWVHGVFDTEKALNAGLNIEMPQGKVYAYKRIKKLLQNGVILPQQIDSLVFATLRTKLLFAGKVAQTYHKNLVGCIQHRLLALEAAEKSAVLLKNDQNLLPLNPNALKTIAVVGYLAKVKQTGDRGSSSVINNKVVTAYEGIKHYAKQYNIQVLTAPANNLQKIKQVCAKADVVVVIAGATYKEEGEYIGYGKIRNPDKPHKTGFFTKLSYLANGGDRQYLHLNPKDIALIKTAAAANPRTIVSLVAGSAITVEEWHEQTPAILQTFYNGVEGGTALAHLLFGKVNPSGKLPFTVPVHADDLPPFNSFLPDADYGYYHGYTLFDKEKKQARYPFGFGLSYTRFLLQNLQTNRQQYSPQDTISLTATLTNTGNRAGAQVVQLYTAYPDTKIDRPIKNLRAFTKIMLQPNETKTITLRLPIAELAYYNPAAKQWITETGTYKLLLGNSSADEGMLITDIEVR
ncbi:MAG TPA: glycoside hydrolase family 3 C-terminal domain-containing protein [Chitinophagales bacterium]|nr:glycoside hydrolase family 3 C-terminal domain-containing protein [Chitinophagales bacterium]